MCDKLYVKQGYCNPRFDKCLISKLEEINAPGELKTLASCCGHGVYPTTIVVKRKKDGFIYEFYSKIFLGKRKRNRYYRKDQNGYYYIPEIINREN